MSIASGYLINLQAEFNYGTVISHRLISVTMVIMDIATCNGNNGALMPVAFVLTRKYIVSYIEL